MSEKSYHELVDLYGEAKARDIMEERAAVKRLEAAIATIGNDLHWYWRWGDSMGGWVLDQLADVVRDKGYRWPLDRAATSNAPKKDKISRSLAKRVFERDAYRCVTCSSHIDLCCDHIVAEIKGGATTFENLQTMCRPCNARKGAR